MRRLVLIVALALVTGVGAAAADTFVAVPTILPGAHERNAADLVTPQALETPPAVPEIRSPEELRHLWEAAGVAYGIPWSVLGAVNKVESDFGRNMGPSSAGAVGWMQFMPTTWQDWGTDASGDGVADPWNPEDAIYSAARYLAANGGETDVSGALFAYNHADWYVDKVLALAAQYERGDGAAPASLDEAESDVDNAQAELDSATQALETGLATVEDLQQKRDDLLAGADEPELLDERLAMRQDSAELGVQVLEAESRIDELRAHVTEAEQALQAARSSASTAALAPSPAPAAVLRAPVFIGGYAFPVAGGARLVVVPHTHHDYPAADIAAPAGTPLYALAGATVASSWSLPEGRCGIGFTMTTGDGRQWTYCHLSYLDARVAPGAALVAGDFVGLVGMTGHATGTHLHLQLQPASSYPQVEPWFTAFAGIGFRWAEDAAPAPASDDVFALVDEGP